MHCPFCNATETRVIDSRLMAEGQQIKRRRACVTCTERFSTYEVAELVMPRVIKRDGRRQPFDEHRLRAGMLRALEKRPVSSEAIETLVTQIKQRVRATGEREVDAKQIGEWVMDALRQLDEVAYIRFASVYRRFTEVREFQQAIEGLEKL